MHLNPKAFADAIELKSAEEGGDEDANAIVNKALGDLTKTVDDRFAAVEKKAADRLDKIEAKLARPAIITGTVASDEEIEKKAVRAFYQTGDETELKALSTVAGTTGITAPPQLSTTILERITTVSPIRELSSSISMTSGMISIPRLVTEVEPGEVAELTPDPRPESEPSFEQIDLKAFEMAHFVPVSRQALEDANVDLSGYLANHLVRKFGQTERRWFMVGNGTSQPEGVLNSSEVGVFTAATTTLTLDAIIDAFHGLKNGYRQSAAWLMNSKTMAALHKLKDGDNRPLWQPSIQPGLPATLFGRPVYEAPEMPDIAAGSTPILFGDFASGYLIADRIAFEPLREDRATSPVIHIGGRRRVGGRVVMGEAILKLKMKAA